MIRILVPLDGSKAAETALDHAVLIAKAFPAELTLLRVIAESDTGAAVRMNSVDFALLRRQAQAYLAGLRETFSAPDLSVRYEVVEGSAAETVIRFVAEKKPDLVVLTRYGLGSAVDFAAGGTAQKIVSGVVCSVLLLDPRSPFDVDEGYHRILVPIDDGENCNCALAIATMIAEIQNASLLLVYVAQEPYLPAGSPATLHTRKLMREMHRILQVDADRRLHEQASKIPKQVSVATRAMVSSDPSFAIESIAKDYECDLLLLHTTADPQEGRVRYGTVNESLIQYSHQSLFILRPAVGEGFMSNFRSVYLNEPCIDAG